MKIELTKDKKIKGKLREAGDTVTVHKDLGERLISEGLANRIIGEQENRMASDGRRFCDHESFCDHERF